MKGNPYLPSPHSIETKDCWNWRLWDKERDREKEREREVERQAGRLKVQKHYRGLSRVPARTYIIAPFNQLLYRCQMLKRGEWERERGSKVILRVLELRLFVIMLLVFFSIKLIYLTEFLFDIFLLKIFYSFKIYVIRMYI